MRSEEKGGGVKGEMGRGVRVMRGMEYVDGGNWVDSGVWRDTMMVWMNKFVFNYCVDYHIYLYIFTTLYQWTRLC